MSTTFKFFDEAYPLKNSIREMDGSDLPVPRAGEYVLLPSSIGDLIWWEVRRVGHNYPAPGFVVINVVVSLSHLDFGISVAAK